MNTSAQRQMTARPAPQKPRTTSIKPVEYSTPAGAVIKLDYDTVKSYLVSGDPKSVSDQEVGMFIRMCQYNGLNPFLKEAYLIKYGSQPAQMITSKDVFIKRAQADANFDGMEAGVVVVNRSGEIENRTGTIILKGEELVGGWANVYLKNYSHPVSTSVNMNEYSTGKSTWTKMPGTMIRKVALMHALREAFPAAVSGLYVAEEMGEAANNTPAPSDVPDDVVSKNTKEAEVIDAEIVDDDAEAEELFR